MQLLTGSGTGQIGAETAQQNKVRGGEGLLSERYERVCIPSGISSPPLANAIHDTPLIP